MFTDTQKASIRLYLGYPDAFRDKHTRLESILAAGGVSGEAETIVIDCLAKIVTIEAALLESGTEGAGIKRVDEIWFDNGLVRTSQIRKMGRMYVSRISITCGVPIYSDVFGGGGYLGDSFSGSGGGARYGSGSFYGLG